MEWQFRINWPALVEEAKQRRKSQRLTQARLALLAGVSTPTISRFESGETDIQLPSVLRILRVLGMLDRRMLTFPEPDPYYDARRQIVSFTGKDENKIITCGITQQALEDYFKGFNKNLVKIFKSNHERIEHEARRKYLAERIETDGSVLIKPEDF